MDSNPILSWLAAECRTHLLDEKWLVSDQLRVAQLWRDRLVMAGCDHFNLHLKTLRMLAHELARPIVVREGGEIISSGHVQLLIRSVLSRLSDSRPSDSRHLNYFTGMHSIDGLTRLMTRTFDDLQLADIQADEIIPDVMESAEKALDWQTVLCSVRELMHSQKWFDYAGCLRLASRAIGDGSIALPKELRLLIPEELTLTRCEREFLQALGSQITIVRPPTAAAMVEPSTSLPMNAMDEAGVSVDGWAAVGEANEIRGVFQKVLTNDKSTLDQVEILVTDYHAYVPLIFDTFCKWQLATQSNFSNDASHVDGPANISSPEEPTGSALQELPVTFAEGIACVYSRPGRLLRSWMRLAASDYLQSNLVVILREGLLRRPIGGETVGYARLADALRRVPIGFGFDRYLPQIDKELARLRSEQAEYMKHVERDEGANATTHNRDFGIPVLEAVRHLLSDLWPLAPDVSSSPDRMLESALHLLRGHARAESKLDRYALARLCEEIEAMLATCRRFPDFELDVHSWLEYLPANSRILASSPRPGAVHVAPISHGGASGRPRSFIVGMDESRFPKPRSVDPLLLDAERQRLSAELETSHTLAHREQVILEQILARKRGQAGASLTLSYSVRQLHDDRDCFPSPLMTELLRKHNHAIDGLDQIAFVNRNSQEHLDNIESQLARLLTTDSSDSRRQFAIQNNLFLRQRFVAQDSISQPMLSGYDGLVPDAGQRWIERLETEHVSPSRLETMGNCPRKFFFRHTLGISPPDDCEIDHTRWLSPLAIGNLIHELFEQFLRDLTHTQLVPDPARDGVRLQSMLDTRLARLVDEVPVPNRDAYEHQRDELAEFCDIFLTKEAEYCAAHGAQPWVVEASLGAHGSQPRDAITRTPLDCETAIPLELEDGSVLRLAGRMDRVDRLMIDGSQRYIIWDYKSGSDRDFNANDPLVQGRKLQPYLYLHMLRHRLVEQGHSPDCVHAFGYFFPNPRTEGRRLEWTALQLQQGQTIVQQLTTMIKQGVFIATNNAEDCKYCDYANVCGDPSRTVAITTLKMQHDDNVQLEPWRALRDG